MSELRDSIQQVIENEPVALFRKGTPQFVMCGNSERALRAWSGAGAPVSAVDILPDPAIRRELSALSGWPTIPQVFVRGELIGGADIVEELAATVELGPDAPEVLAWVVDDAEVDQGQPLRPAAFDLVERPVPRLEIDVRRGS